MDTEQAYSSADHAAKGTEHLQSAARELIGAARSFLDAAEELLEDSEFVDDAASAIRTVAEDLGAFARRSGATFAAGDGNAGPGSASQAPDAHGAGERVGPDPDRESREQAGSREQVSSRVQDVTEGTESVTLGDSAAKRTRVRRIDVE